MPLLRQAVKRLVVYGAAVIALCLPAWSETLIDVEKREVGTLFRQAVIPVAANSPGRFGAHYKTRVVIFNPTSRDYSITAVLYGGNGEVSRRVISMDANSYRGYDNFLEEVFNYRGSGGIWLTAPDQEDAFYVTAEVYTDSANGRFSTTVVNGIVPVFSEGYGTNYNVGIFVNRNRRTNIGVLNWDTKPSSIKAKVFDSHGMQIQTISFELAAEAWQQKSISTPVDDGFVEWEINGESDEHYFYAVEVDNRSNDGTLTWCVQGSSSPGSGGGGGGGGTAPDLVVQAPSVSDSSLSTGASFTLSATVRNQGNGPSAATTLRYYRSPNAIISTIDAEVGTDSVSSLSASSTSAESISLTAPSSAGTYYYGACVEPMSGESNTGNNCSSGVRVTVSDGGTGGGLGSFSLASANRDPRGITFANGRLFVTDLNDEKLYAYDASGRNVPGADLDLATLNVWPAGITFANGRFYVVDWLFEKVFAYDASGRHVPDADFDLASANTSPHGITFANGRLYVADFTDEKLYAYDASGRHVPSANFDLASANTWPRGITFANGRFHVVDRIDDKVYAYDASGRHVPSADFDLASANTVPEGITFANGRFYVVDDADHKVYAYDASVPAD